jgi:hypothetical protein
VARVYAESFSGLQIFDNQFTGEFEPRHALTAEALEEEAIAAEDAGA